MELGLLWNSAASPGVLPAGILAKLEDVWDNHLAKTDDAVEFLRKAEFKMLERRQHSQTLAKTVCKHTDAHRQAHTHTQMASVTSSTLWWREG